MSRASGFEPSGELLRGAVTEKQFQQAVEEGLAWTQTKAFHYSDDVLSLIAKSARAGGRFDQRHWKHMPPKGFPDLMIVKAPVLVFAELKRLGQKPRPEQEAWLDELSACNHIVVRHWEPCQEDWEEIDLVLAGRGTELKTPWR